MQTYICDGPLSVGCGAGCRHEEQCRLARQRAVKLRRPLHRGTSPQGWHQIKANDERLSLCARECVQSIVCSVDLDASSALAWKA
jgi:hypothetical protein